MMSLVRLNCVVYIFASGLAHNFVASCELAHNIISIFGLLKILNEMLYECCGECYFFTVVATQKLDCFHFIIKRQPN